MCGVTQVTAVYSCKRQSNGAISDKHTPFVCKSFFGRPHCELKEHVWSKVCRFRACRTPWSESANELYQSSDHRLSAKIVPVCPDRGCDVVSVSDPYGRILDFLDRRRSLSVLRIVCSDVYMFELSNDCVSL
jgi:hypothetical protein